MAVSYASAPVFLLTLPFLISLLLDGADTLPPPPERSPTPCHLDPRPPLTFHLERGGGSPASAKELPSSLLALQVFLSFALPESPNQSDQSRWGPD